mmetsp:Transcript_201/g.536  ORF Transcript_201/g.536 Transcript_201/m.536 type:complete len:402 (-) Transcript_201:108-1313(-)
MPSSPFASQAPLSPSLGGGGGGGGGSGGGGVGMQRRNPFASSDPLVLGPPPVGAQPRTFHHQPPPTMFQGMGVSEAGSTQYSAHQRGGGAPGGLQWPTSEQQGLGASALSPPPQMQGSNHLYPTPPEMQQQGAPLWNGLGGDGEGSGGRQQQQQMGVVVGLGMVGGSVGSEFGGGVPAAAAPSLFIPDALGSGGGPSGGGVGGGSHVPTMFIPVPVGGQAAAAGWMAGASAGSGMGSAAMLGTAPLPGRAGTPVEAPAISLRGRERYCSGGAWVGPAPEWPKPPANATIASADTSRVLPQHRNIVAVIGEKFGALAAGAAGMRKKELEGISTKLGGMLVFLNEGEGEEHVSAPVAEQLSRLCDAMQAGDVNAVTAHLLYISTNHWEEAAYWFPALKRLTKL